MNRMYVLVRRDLPVSYQAVQAGHAVAEYLIKNSSTEWWNETLIYLGVENEEHLENWIDKLKYYDINLSTFREPDIRNELTAFATVCDGKMFKKLKLL